LRRRDEGANRGCRRTEEGERGRGMDLHCICFVFGCLDMQRESIEGVISSSCYDVGWG
jgi:hypothetical protein